MDTCEKYAALISAAVDGELSAAEQRELMDHLAQCPTCREIYSQMMTMSLAFDELDTDVPGDLTADVMAKIRMESTAKKPRRNRWWQIGAAAACCALVILGYQQSQNTGFDDSAALDTAATAVGTITSDTASSDDSDITYTTTAGAHTATPNEKQQDIPDEVIMENVLTYFRGRPEVCADPPEEIAAPGEEQPEKLSLLVSSHGALREWMEQNTGAEAYVDEASGAVAWMITGETAALLEEALMELGVAYVLENTDVPAEDLFTVCVVYAAEELPDDAPAAPVDPVESADAVNTVEPAA